MKRAADACLWFIVRREGGHVFVRPTRTIPGVRANPRRDRQPDAREGYERIGFAKPVLDTTDGALNEVEGIITRIRNIANPGGTDSLNGQRPREVLVKSSTRCVTSSSRSNTTAAIAFFPRRYIKMAPPCCAISETRRTHRFSGGHRKR